MNLSDADTAAALPAAPAAAAAATVELFGSFFLGTDEFALPASCIREVVNFPARISALPLSPAYLEGMFTLRGSVIPVVNLGRLFNPAAPGADPSHKIAILDFQQVQLGILFHDTGEILRVRPEQRSELSYAGGDRHGIIAGTILLDGGERLLQILDASALIKIENVPHVLARKAATQRQNLHYHAQADRRKCVSFRVGGAAFAFDMAAIQEIINVPEIHSSILNSKLCLGRINFRGSQVAIVDFAALLSAGPAGEAAGEAGRDPGSEAARVAQAGQRIIIARIDDATVGFLVDAVESIVHFFSDELMPIPLLSKARAGMFAGCLSKPDQGDIIFLDHREIFSSNEIMEMRNGHANLFPEEGGGKAKNSEARNSKRQVYITFALETTFALEIKQVREIIDFSDNISCPPGMPPFLRGMLNLRQQMISVIDLRQLYHMAPAARTEQSKILIVERGEERYGLMVDAVENIITVADSQRFTAPKMIRGAGANDCSLRSEMDEVIDIASEQDSTTKTLSVFECGRLLERLSRELPVSA
ncbi:chemotaxis protein CheW [Oxalobacteraceae bacterium]|nr:chemotaxis protein CheW [Oxalobacteraceae bacterium]